MPHATLRRRGFLLLAFAAACTRAASDDPWPSGRVLAPAALAKTLGGDAAARPLVLHVGPKVLFKKARLPGAVHPGETGEPEGLAALASYAEPLARDRAIVLYCGCCPWDHCPNIRPAYRKLNELGFTDVSVLDLPKTLQANWTDQGYPVETG